MHQFSLPHADSFAAIRQAARERILILDGAMGTMIQTLNMSEEDFTANGHIHGPGCRHTSDHPQKGNNDLLVLTQPQAVEDIQLEFALAGADILETNTFSSTTIAQADYGLEGAVHDLNVAGAQVARRAADRATAQDGKPRFVAGAVGPTNRTASISPDVNDPGYRAVTFD
ncbi:MAG: homocysteine S-methyltransferase family protein, partial [Pseudomonadota bacterium]|nr:homocysteine S-methyltransferase family protein [Pseudomonadota bacterium]